MVSNPPWCGKRSSSAGPQIKTVAIRMERRGESKLRRPEVVGAKVSRRPMSVKHSIKFLGNWVFILPGRLSKTFLSLNFLMVRIKGYFIMTQFYLSLSGLR